MKKLYCFSMIFDLLQRKWMISVLITVVASTVLLLITMIHMGFTSPSLTYQSATFISSDEIFMKSLHLASDLPIPPRFAYLVSGTKGDLNNIKRLVLAIYHPRNHYLLHLDREAPLKERVALANFARQFTFYQEGGNVHVVGKSDVVSYKGSSMVASVLHGAAILLRYSKHWDWFIHLSASDYPLVTQDDLLQVFSYLPKDLNFVEHTSFLGWREYQTVKPMVVDPGLFMQKKADIYWLTQRRPIPTAFRLFSGSSGMVLTRRFMEYCVFGWDNLPRILLMYYANSVSPVESYFQTVICNSREFQNTTVNHDLDYIVWDSPMKQNILSLTVDHFHNMTKSGAAFGRKVIPDDKLLDKIDTEQLGRRKDQVTPGGWCVGSSRRGNPCAVLGDPNILKPGPGAKKLQTLILNQLSTDVFRPNQCAIQDS